MSIYWRLLRPELLTLLKGLVVDKNVDYKYDDDLDEIGLSSDSFSLFAQNGSDSGKHDARIRVATEFLMAVQVPKVADALVARPATQWWDGEDLTELFHSRGVNMRHIGAVWNALNEKCQTLGEDDAGVEEHKSARRAVVQEMYVRAAKNLLRRDLRGAMDMGAGARELEQIVAKTFTRMSPGDEESDAYLCRVWHGVEQRFGATTGEEQISEQQRESVSALWAVQRVAKAVGVRLTQSCLDDLEKETVETKLGDTNGQHPFAFTVADIDSMQPRVKFLDVLNKSEGLVLARELKESVASGGGGVSNNGGGVEGGECKEGGDGGATGDS